MPTHARGCLFLVSRWSALLQLYNYTDKALFRWYGISPTVSRKGNTPRSYSPAGTESEWWKGSGLLLFVHYLPVIEIVAPSFDVSFDHKGLLLNFFLRNTTFAFVIAHPAQSYYHASECVWLDPYLGECSSEHNEDHFCCCTQRQRSRRRQRNVSLVRSDCECGGRVWITCCWVELSLDKGLRVLLIKLNSRDSPQSVDGWLAAEWDQGEEFALKLIIRCYYGWSGGDAYAR